jgi:hypothetical protein
VPAVGPASEAGATGSSAFFLSRFDDLMLSVVRGPGTWWGTPQSAGGGGQGGAEICWPATLRSASVTQPLPHGTADVCAIVVVVPDQFSPAHMHPVWLEVEGMECGWAGDTRRRRQEGYQCLGG